MNGIIIHVYDSAVDRFVYKTIDTFTYESHANIRPAGSVLILFNHTSFIKNNLFDYIFDDILIKICPSSLQMLSELTTHIG